ncbi:MAG TPA: acetyl-CoA carboxylase biotin carboxyl carrier protein subunit [Saprospiraceae bacterium]|nr:acetyl-CoA carboxylase biotin carboxyl carrier protein subunit [Saprospiraceae bacterium]
MTKLAGIKAIVNNENEFIISEEEASGLNLIKLEGNTYHIIRNNIGYILEVLEKYSNKSYKIRIQNRVYTVNLQDSFEQNIEKLGLAIKTQQKLSEIKAPMPGTVLEVMVIEGQAIQKGDALVILEAMKMENIIKASGDGIIETINIIKGSSVDKNQIMLKLK